MSRKLVLAMTLMIVLIGMIGSSFRVQRVKGSGTIYIRADGSVDPPDAPISSVDNVTYTFTDNINDSIVVERDNIVVDGACYALEGTGTGRAIDLTRRSNVTIKNMKIKGFDVGIYLSYSSNNVISGNNITNTPFRGIFLHRSSNNSVIENMFAGCGLFVWGSYQNTMEGNTVNGKLLVYLENISGYIVKDAGQVILVNCNNIQVKNLNLSNTTIGVQLWNTKNTIVADNNITNNYYGIYLGSSSNNNSISGNNITNNGDGIWLDDSSNYNVISGNNITYNSYHGIYLDWSSYNSISGNNINNTFRSIYLYGSSYNNISGNNITNDTHCGICLISSSNNVIVHNNFIGNAEQVYSYLSVNVWDDGYPSGGNFWSDYEGVDEKSGSNQDQPSSDGVGDTAYAIDVNNTDRYPLMAPINIFDAGTWNEVNYYVDVVSNSTISDFYFNPDEGAFLRFYVSGENETLGFCRVAIPEDLLWVEDGWTIHVGGEPITNYTILSDENYTHLYFTYNHSTKTVIIQGTNVIPEFPTWTSMLLIITVLTFAVAICKRRLKTLPNKDTKSRL